MSVTTSPAIDGDLLASLNAFLSSHVDASAPMLVPSSYLVPGHTYIMTATMCNFLSSCASAFRVSKISSMAFPSVTIPGPSTASFLRSQAIAYEVSLLSGALDGCMSGSPSR